MVKKNRMIDYTILTVVEIHSVQLSMKALDYYSFIYSSVIVWISDET